MLIAIKKNMPRNRQIKADFWSDEKIGRLSIPARLMFIGLWNFSDDSGVCRANPMYIKNQIFPYDAITVKKTHSLLSECSQHGLIRLMEYSNEQYLEIINFTKHQLINRPSKFRYIQDLGNTHNILTDTSLTNVNENVNENVNGNDKDKHLEFVSLLESEHKKLLTQFGDERLKVMIENLNNYLGSTGKKYKSHYHTLLSWERKNGTVAAQQAPRIKFNPEVPFDEI